MDSGACMCVSLREGGVRGTASERALTLQFPSGDGVSDNETLSCRVEETVGAAGDEDDLEDLVHSHKKTPNTSTNLKQQTAWFVVVVVLHHK